MHWAQALFNLSRVVLTEAISHPIGVGGIGAHPHYLLGVIVVFIAVIDSDIDSIFGLILQVLTMIPKSSVSIVCKGNEEMRLGIRVPQNQQCRETARRPLKLTIGQGTPKTTYFQRSCS